MQHKDVIRRAYINVVSSKKELGLIGDDSPLNKISDSTKIADYPILAVVAHNQLFIDMFKNKILEKVKMKLSNVS